MRKFLKFKTILIIVTVVLFAGVVYAATSYSVPAGGGVTKVDEWGLCKNVTNNNGLPLFVPTNSSAEWNSLVNNGTPNVSFANCMSPGPSCTYAWGVNQNTCGDSGNAFPLSPVSGSCDINNVDSYRVISSTGANPGECNFGQTGNGTRYTYQKCTSSCSTSPACSITIVAGGLGGSTNNFQIGWGFSVNNSAGSASNCTVAPSVRYGNSSHYLNTSYGPYTAAPGSNNGNGPAMGIDSYAWQGQPIYSFDVSATPVITCPSGTTLYPAAKEISRTLLGYGSTMNGGTTSFTFNCY